MVDRTALLVTWTNGREVARQSPVLGAAQGVGGAQVVELSLVALLTNFFQWYS